MKSKHVKSLLVSANIYGQTALGPGEEANHPEENVMKEYGYHYVVDDYNMSDEETKIALLAKQTIHIKTIKNILIFFLIMYLLGISITLYYLIKFIA